MDARLRQILELALRADTGEGESAAALAAARRLVAKQGMDLLGAAAPERVVYRDKVIYQTKPHDHTVTYTLTIPARYHHTMIERVFLDAQDLNCEVQLISCTTRNKAILSGTIMEFKVSGTASAITQYGSTLDSYVSQMRQKEGQSDDYKAPSAKKAPKKGWFSRLFS